MLIVLYPHFSGLNGLSVSEQLVYFASPPGFESVNILLCCRVAGIFKGALHAAFLSGRVAIDRFLNFFNSPVDQNGAPDQLCHRFFEAGKPVVQIGYFFSFCLEQQPPAPALQGQVEIVRTYHRKHGSDAEKYGGSACEPYILKIRQARNAV